MPDTGVSDHENPLIFLIAGLFSTILPGSGQVLRKRYARAMILFTIWAVIVTGSAVLRLWASFWLSVVVLWGVFFLNLAVGWDASFGRCDSGVRKKKTKLLVALFIVPAFLGMYVTAQAWRLAGYKPFSVPSTSMEPTIMRGDNFIADMRYYKRNQINRGDLVLAAGKDAITFRRVIAGPGDTIEGRDGKVYVNGAEILEPYAKHVGLSTWAPTWMSRFGPTMLGPKQYFMMGDNRDISYDSRSPEVGPIDAEAIKGRPLYIIKSPMSGRNGQAIN